MPLTILLPFVVFGILGAVLLINWLKPTPPLMLANPDQALAIWQHFNPDLPASAVYVNSSRTHAIAETAKGLGVIWAMGADPVTRLLAPGYTVRETARGVRLTTHDFTAPYIDIPLPHAVQRKEWRVLLESKR